MRRSHVVARAEDRVAVVATKGVEARPRRPHRDRCRDLGEGGLPIPPIPALQAHLPALKAGDDAPAIVLDLVLPFRPESHDCRQHGLAGLDDARGRRPPVARLALSSGRASGPIKIDTRGVSQSIYFDFENDGRVNTVSISSFDRSRGSDRGRGSTTMACPDEREIFCKFGSTQPKEGGKKPRKFFTGFSGPLGNPGQFFTAHVVEIAPKNIWFPS